MSNTIFTRLNTCTLAQTHKTEYSTLIVSGCSFTESDPIAESENPLTWPSYLCHRAGFTKVINVAAGGAGNEYIAAVMLDQLESMTDEELKDCVSIVMWSGIGRKDHIKYSKSCHDQSTKIEFTPVSTTNYSEEALRSWKNIITMQNYLENKKIPFGFSFFVNTFDPPFLPRRMESNQPWENFVSADKIKKLRQCRWIHDHKKSLFEHCFYNDFLGEDLFHPTHYGHLSWTDHVLLPGLEKMGLISAVDQ